MPPNQANQEDNSSAYNLAKKTAVPLKDQKDNQLGMPMKPRQSRNLAAADQ